MMVGDLLHSAVLDMLPVVACRAEALQRQSVTTKTYDISLHLRI